jgi:prefoldin subunit 5
VTISIFKKRTKKVNEFETANAKLDEIASQLNELNDKVDSLQRSLALFYQIVPDKLREAIVDGLNERNRRSYPL